MKGLCFKMIMILNLNMIAHWGKKVVNSGRPPSLTHRNNNEYNLSRRLSLEAEA